MVIYGELNEQVQRKYHAWNSLRTRKFSIYWNEDQSLFTYTVSVKKGDWQKATGSIEYTSLKNVKKICLFIADTM